MNNCNDTQKETGGKDMLIKLCKDIVASITAGTGTVSEVEVTAHGLRVGDIVRFNEIGTLTEVELDKYYFVKAILDADGFTIAATPGGAAITFTHSAVALEAEAFEAIGGGRTKSKAFSADGIEITNEDSDQWQTMLDGKGIRSFQFSAEGVYNNGLAYQRLESRAMNQLLTCLLLIDVKNLKITEGCFKITSLEESGDHDAEGTYSMSADSSGEVFVTQVVA